jgi:hypothetical protein
MTTQGMQPSEIRSGLAHFTGTQSYTRTMARSVVMTDGVKWLCDNAGSHWLIDAVVSHVITNAKLRLEEFQVWTLYVRQGTSPLFYPAEKNSKVVIPTQFMAVLTVTDGNSKKPLVAQRIEYTDFPLPEIKFYCTPGAVGDERVWVIMLTSEY